MEEFTLGTVQSYEVCVSGRFFATNDQWEPSKNRILMRPEERFEEVHCIVYVLPAVRVSPPLGCVSVMEGLEELPFTVNVESESS